MKPDFKVLVNALVNINYYCVQLCFVS